jgi:hypothetical protein
MDLVIFAGPVILRKAFDAIPWRTPTHVVPVVGSGSSYFGSLGAQLRDSNGRILPNLLQRYAGGSARADWDKVALTAWSAGWGLLNQVFKQEADRREVDACIATDASFGSGLTGYEAYAADAAMGRSLMVATTTNNPANYRLGIMKTARDTWVEIQGAASAATGKSPREVGPKPPMPPATGGVWRTGSSLYWYDYVAPGSAPGHGNDFSHAEHHDLAPLAWEAYLVPLFAGTPWQLVAGLGIAAAGVVGAAVVWRK